eukprot:216034_1
MGTALGVVIRTLSCIFYSVTSECPLNYVYCGAGTEGTICNEQGVVSYGQNTLWTNTLCDSQIDYPTITDSNITNECYIQTPDISGSFTKSPLINTISCDDNVQGYIQEDEKYYYQVVVDNATIIEVSNCGSEFDGKLKFGRSDEKGNFVEMKDESTCQKCDDCGSQVGDCLNQETFLTKGLIPNENYYLKIETKKGKFGIYDLSISCLEYDLLWYDKKESTAEWIHSTTGYVSTTSSYCTDSPCVNIDDTSWIERYTHVTGYEFIQLQFGLD